MSAPDNTGAIIVDISSPDGKFVTGAYYAEMPWENGIIKEMASEGEAQPLIGPWQNKWSVLDQNKIISKPLHRCITCPR